MTEGPWFSEALRRSRAFTRRLEQEGVPSLEGLDKSFRQLRRNSRWIMLIAFIEFLLACGGIFLAHRASVVAHKALDNEKAIITACEVGNQTRATERTVWDYVLNVTPQQPQTDAQKEQSTAFKKFLDINLAQRDCSKELTATPSATVSP